MTLAELAKAVDVPSPTVFRLLRDLETRGWVFRSRAKTYSLGPAVVGVAHMYLRRSSVISASEPVMRRLRDDTGETVSLTALAGNYRIYVAECPSFQPLRFVHEVGALSPVHAGASGRAVLSLLDAETRRFVLSGPLEAYSDSTITDLDALEASIAEVQREGYAVSYGERSVGAVGIAVPFRDPVSDAPYSMAIFMPMVRFDPSKIDGYVAKLQAAVREIVAVNVGN